MSNLNVLKAYLIAELGPVPPEKVLQVVAHDKKNINGKLNFILIDDIGNGIVTTDVTKDDIVESLQAVC